MKNLTISFSNTRSSNLQIILWRCKLNLTDYLPLESGDLTPAIKKKTYCKISLNHGGSQMKAAELSPVCSDCKGF